MKLGAASDDKLRAPMSVCIEGLMPGVPVLCAGVFGVLLGGLA